MTKNLAITVLTWNDWENTVKCLESIYQSTFSDFDVILVNNNSDQIHLDKIYHTIEYGIAQNNNHGLIEAIALLSGGIVLKHNNSNGISIYNQK